MSQHFLHIGETQIGSGRPWIIVPIAGKTKKNVLQKATEIAANPYVELAEWRADHFRDVWAFERTISILQQLKQILGCKKLIFSFRNHVSNTMDINSLLAIAVQSSYVDIVDVDVNFFTQPMFAEFLDKSHRNNCMVMGSYHNFEFTPDEETLLKLMRQIQEKGADIVKVAVMPKEKEDVLTLLRATNKMYREFAMCPIITISMSPLGSISRIVGEYFGSSMSYGTMGHVTDPGQLPAETLNAALNIVHTYIVGEEKWIKG